MGDPSTPEVPRRLADVLAATGLVLVAGALVAAFVVDRPSRLPPSDEQRSQSCEDLRFAADWVAGVRTQGPEGPLGPSSYYEVEGQLRYAGERLQLACTTGEVIDVESTTNLTGARGVFLVRLDGRGAEVERACFGCELPPPYRRPTRAQQVATALRELAMIAGVVGALLMGLGRALRPFDPIRDLIGGPLPRSAHALERPTNDRIRLGDRELAGPFVIARAEGLSTANEADGGCIELPGARAHYRESAGGLAHLIGPARIFGIAVPPRERIPIAEGDPIELPRDAPRSVAFAQPGCIVRFFHGDEAHARFARRVESGRAIAIAAAATGCAALGATIALVDASFTPWVGVPLVAASLFALLAVPARLSVIETVVVEHGKLSALRLTRDLEAVEARLDGKLLVRLPSPAASEIAAAAVRELEAISAHAREAVVQPAQRSDDDRVGPAGPL